MTIKQQIYGQFRFPMGNKTTDELFDEYSDYKVYREDGVQVGGIGAARDVSNNIAILMTYDADSELLLRLKLFGLPDLKHHEYVEIK